MKKLVLLSSVSIMSVLLVASTGGEPIKITPKPRTLAHGHSSVQYHRVVTPTAGSRSSRTLQRVRVGSAGNLLTVLNSDCHQLHVDSALNTVIFVHRNNQTDVCCNQVGSNVAQYRFDVSENGGTTWKNDIGPLNKSADNNTINGRYPQAMIHTLPGTTVADSAYIVYNGSWHNGGNPISVWQGQYYGRAKLSGDTSTFTEKRDIVDTAKVEIGTSMVRNPNGTYFNLNKEYVQSTVNSSVTTGLVIERGKWNDVTRDIDWSYQVVPITFSDIISTTSGSPYASGLISQTIAFDPSGKYGWICMNADISKDNTFRFTPVLMHSTDSGATWSQPQQLNLDGIPGIAPLIGTTLATPTNTHHIPGPCQVTVDMNGNPHIAAIVSETDSTDNTYTSFLVTGLNLYDIHYDPTSTSCPWNATYLDSVNSFSADYTVAQGSNPKTNESNRVQIARSADGKKFFVFWTDSDPSVVANAPDVNNTNAQPNLFGVGVDLGLRKITAPKNFTVGDPLFGGATTTVAAGSLQGALFPVVSQNIFESATKFNVPVVLTEPDYNAPVGQKVNINPVRFYYCQNIDFLPSDFVNKYDNSPPAMNIGGAPDTVWVKVGTKYTPPSITASDCHDGPIVPVFSSNLHTNTGGFTDSVGHYTATWTATNQAGNSATFSQTVLVADTPVPVILYKLNSNVIVTYNGRHSKNFVSLYRWNFGDNSALSTVDSVKKTYSASLARTTRNVTLCVSNPVFAPKYFCDSVKVFLQLGISDPAFDKMVNLFPNPTSGKVTIELESGLAEEAKVSILNLAGQQVSETVLIKANVTSTSLNVDNLESGLYFVKIESKSGISIKELSINK